MQAWCLGGADGTSLKKWRSFGHFPGGVHRLALAPPQPATRRAGGAGAGCEPRPFSAASTRTVGAATARGGGGDGDAAAGGALQTLARAAAGSAGGGEGCVLVSGSVDGSVAAWQAGSLEPLFQINLGRLDRPTSGPSTSGGRGGRGDDGGQGLSCLAFCSSRRLLCAAGDTARCS